MRSLLLLLMLCVGNVAFADLNLQINGPTEGKTGDLIVINSTGSNATSQAWIIPDALISKTLTGCGDQLGFATRTPGTYTFYLYGTDGEGLLHASHTVTITGNGVVEPPPIDKPDPPPTDKPGPTDPPPVGNFDSLKKTSHDRSIALNDQSTRTLLGQNLSQESFGDTLRNAQLSVESIITKVLASRPRDRQDADWFNGWYIPVLKQIRQSYDQGQIKTVAQYNQAIAAVTSGLKD